MARTKQTATPKPPEAMPEALVLATRTPNLIKDKLLEMEFVQSDTQMCEYLSLKWDLARMTQNGIGHLEEELEINRTSPRPMSQEETQAITTGLEAMRKELSTVLGEIALIFCPVKDCPTHTNGTKNDNYVAESNSKINDNNSTEQNNNDTNITKEKAPVKIPKMIKIIHKIKNEQDRRNSNPLRNSQEKS
ncbi:uncharacterized protein TNCV_3719681 [Trichonephila clavipes]|nr:uncharacterized protein TNCV_3719681 [Trichonephila clavipes]